MKFDLRLQKAFSDTGYLWKYFDLLKFLYFIEEEKLFFTRADHFDDPIEGLPYKLLFEELYYSQVRNPENLNPNITVDGAQAYENEIQEGKKRIEKQTQQYQQGTFINCWTQLERESYAMWDLYASNNGIAIKFKANNLLSLVTSCVEQFKSDSFKDVVADSVKYEVLYPYYPNNEAQFSMNQNVFAAFKKDKCYSHENEFRFIAYALDGHLNDFFELPLGPIKEIDFEIAFHPRMEYWKRKSLKKLLKRFELEEKIIPSLIRVRNK